MRGADYRYGPCRGWNGTFSLMCCHFHKIMNLSIVNWCFPQHMVCVIKHWNCREQLHQFRVCIAGARLENYPKHCNVPAQLCWRKIVIEKRRLFGQAMLSRARKLHIVDARRCVSLAWKTAAHVPSKLCHTCDRTLFLKNLIEKRHGSLLARAPMATRCALVFCWLTFGDT